VAAPAKPTPEPVAPVTVSTAVVAPDEPVVAEKAPEPSAAKPAAPKRSMVTSDWFNRINRDRAAKTDADAASPSDE
jgi:hypothetical protein